MNREPSPQSNLLESPALAAWRVPVHGARSIRTWWVLGTVGCCLCFVFAALLVSPYRSAKLKLVQVIPADTHDRSIDFSDTSKYTLFSASYDSAAVFENLYKTTEAFHRLEGLTQDTPKKLITVVQNACKPRDACLVFVTGILRVSSNGCLLCDSARNAKKEFGIPIGHLLTQLTRCKTKSIILCMEVLEDQNSFATSVAPGLATEQCRSEIEHHLHKPGKTPVAVLLVSSLPANNGLPQAIAQALQSLEATNPQNTVSLATIQHRLRSSVDPAGELEWMVSKNWSHPVAQLLAPRTADSAALAASDEPGTALAGENEPSAVNRSKTIGQFVSFPSVGRAGSTNKLNLVKDKTQFLAGLSTADSIELVEYCWQVYDRWKDYATAQAQVGRLDTPSPNPWQAPQAWKQMELSLKSAQALAEQADSRVLLQDLIDLATAIYALDQENIDSNSFSNRAPWWAIALADSKAMAIPNAPPQSLYCQAADDLLEHRQKHLQELATICNPGTEEGRALQIAAAWQAPRSEGTVDMQPPLSVVHELQWADYCLNLHHVDWPLRQSLLRSRLHCVQLAGHIGEGIDSNLAFRTAVDDLATAQRLVTYRLPENWRENAAIALHRAERGFEQCQRFEDACDRGHAIAFQLLDELPYWSQVLIPHSDQLTANDTICECAIQLRELCHLLETRNVRNSHDIAVLTDTLSQYRQSWQQEVQTELLGDETGNERINIRFYINSPLSSRMSSHSANARATGGEVLLSKEQIWMQLNRLEYLQSIILDDAQVDTRSRCIDAFNLARETLLDVESTPEELHSALESLHACELQWYSAARGLLNSLPISSRGVTRNAVLLASLGGSGQITDELVYQAIHQEHVDTYVANVRFREDELNRADQTAANTLQNEIDAWESLYHQHTAIALPQKRRTLSAEVVTSVDLTQPYDRTIPLIINNLNDMEQDVSIQCQFDPRLIDCIPQFVARRAEGGWDARIHLAPQQSHQLLVGLRTVGQTSANAPVVLRIGGDNCQLTRIIELKTTEMPLVDVHLRNRSATSVPAIDEDKTFAEPLFANRENELQTEVVNRHSRDIVVKAQWFASQQLKNNLPSGVVARQQAVDWLTNQSAIALTATPGSLALAPGESSMLKFAPAPLDPLAPKRIIKSLLLLLESADEDKAQIVAWTPEVIRPASYVAPTVAFDSQDRVIRVQLALSGSTLTPSTPVVVNATALKADDLSQLAIAHTLLTQARPTQELRMQLNSHHGSRVILKLDIDGWPSAFLFEIDDTLSANDIPVSGQLWGAFAQRIPAQIVVPSADHEITVAVETLATDGSFQADRDELLVGIDLNLDRVLWNEPLARVLASTAFHPIWRGCNENGNLNILGQVAVPEVQLSVDPRWNQTCSVLAQLRQGSQRVWSHEATVVIDHQPPTITSVDRVGGTYGLLGPPVEILVSVEDHGLAACANVSGGWSIGGATEITEEVALLPAVKLDNGQWSLKLPTEALRSGSTLLLVQATDAAGNTSPAHPTLIELLTAEDIEQRKRNITTLVRGQVAYGSRPQPNIDVQLVALDESIPLQQLKTDEAGEFLFPRVPSGKYRLKLQGIVRGMRIERSRVIEVNAPQLTATQVFRLEQLEQPAL